MNETYVHMVPRLNAYMPDAAAEALFGPDGPMIQEEYHSVETMENSDYKAIFYALDAVIDMTEAFINLAIKYCIFVTDMV